MSINYTKDTLQLLKVAYEKALKENKDIFIFNGSEFVTKFAKYLIEYAEDKPIKEIENDVK